jgi:hypothetical protein
MFKESIKNTKNKRPTKNRSKENKHKETNIKKRVPHPKYYHRCRCCHGRLYPLSLCDYKPFRKRMYSLTLYFAESWKKKNFVSTSFRREFVDIPCHTGLREGVGYGGPANFVSIMGVWQEVAMDSLKYHLDGTMTSPVVACRAYRYRYRIWTRHALTFQSPMKVPY